MVLKLKCYIYYIFRSMMSTNTLNRYIAYYYFLRFLFCLYSTLYNGPILYFIFLIKKCRASSDTSSIKRLTLKCALNTNISDGILNWNLSY